MGNVKFIALTEYHNSIRYHININTIVRVDPWDDCDLNTTRVETTNGNTYHVTENAAELRSYIEQMSREN